jgi:hypothetical protein
MFALQTESASHADTNGQQAAARHVKHESWIAGTHDESAEDSTGESTFWASDSHPDALAPPWHEPPSGARCVCPWSYSSKGMKSEHAAVTVATMTHTGATMAARCRLIV